MCKSDNPAGFVSEFWNNTFQDSVTQEDSHTVLGVTCDDASAYIAVERGSLDLIYRFIDQKSPLFQRCLQRPDTDYSPTKIMCTTDNYVIVHAEDSSNNKGCVTKVDKDYTKTTD